MTEQETEFQRRAKELLDESADSLDGATLSRLHQARNRALESKQKPLPWQNWTGAGAVAASLALVFLYVDREPAQLPVIYEDPAQQAVAEELDLMDDLDFVAWLVLEEGGTDDAVNRS